MTHAMKKGALEGLIGLVVGGGLGLLGGLGACVWQVTSAGSRLQGALAATLAGVGLAFLLFGSIQALAYALDRRIFFPWGFFATHLFLPGLICSQLTYWALSGLAYLIWH